MPTANFRLHAELNDFLPRGKRQSDIEVAFNGHETIKHLVEALGVPHTEIDVLLVNGISVGFSARLEDGDRIEAYPGSKTPEGRSVNHLQPKNLGSPRFVLDGHLGKLASYLRLLGFNALYRNDYADDELAELSQKDERILLTRDRGLLKRNQVTQGYCVRAKSPKDQTVEVLMRFNMAELAQPFSRCAACNGLLIPVTKDDVYDRLEPKTKLYYDDFQICQQCDQIYWKGSHFRRMEAQLLNLLKLSRSTK